MKTANIATTIGALLLAAGARAGTVTVQGNQTVEGSQLVQSNQTVAGALTSQGSSAEVAATRFRAFGPTASDRWIRVARIGGADLTNAVVSGRLLAQGSAPGNQYVADFAFPGPGQSPYSPVMVEMGGASTFVWAVYASGSDHWLWFRQSSGSKFANFLYGEAGCTAAWETNVSPSGTAVWSSASASNSRQQVRAGGLTLTKGLTLPDGTLLDARSNMTATALINPSNGQKLLEVASGRLLFSGASDFLGSIGLGTNGLAITADGWATVRSGIVGGSGAKDVAGSAAWAVTGMADDAAGNRYAYGYFAGTLRAGAAVLSSGAAENDRAGFVIKIDPVGRMAWARALPVVNHSANGQQNENLVQIAGAVLDGSGNVILAGTFRATADFAGSTNSPSGGGDGFVVSLGPDGTAAWFRQFGGSESAADTFADIAVDSSGASVLAAGARAVSGGTEGRAVRLAASDGAPQDEWALPAAIPQACFSGSSPVVTWDDGYGGHPIRKLGTGGWDSGAGSPVTDMFATPSGDIIVFEAQALDSSSGTPVGQVMVLGGGDGYPGWSEVGCSTGYGDSYDVYDEWGYYIGTQYWSTWNNWTLLDVAVDRSGNAWMAWYGEDGESSDGPNGSSSYSNTYHHVRRHGQGSFGLGHNSTLATDASGDIHALAYVDGRARDVRFDGQSGAQEADSTVEGASGTLLGASQSAHSLVIAGSGAIAQDSDWSASVSVDGLLSAGSGILLGDGTVVATSGDIAALGPVQSGGAGSYFVMGNVGIGTDAPAYGLDVAGTAHVGGALAVAQTLAVGGAMSAAGGSISGDMAVGGNLTVASNLTVLGTSDLARVPPKGDIPMGAFTNGPAQ